jgi:hypothetical protein
MMWPHERPEAHFTSHRLLLDYNVSVASFTFLFQLGMLLHLLHVFEIVDVVLRLELHVIDNDEQFAEQ